MRYGQCLGKINNYYIHLKHDSCYSITTAYELLAKQKLFPSAKWLINS